MSWLEQYLLHWAHRLNRFRKLQVHSQTLCFARLGKLAKTFYWLPRLWTSWGAVQSNPHSAQTCLIIRSQLTHYHPSEARAKCNNSLDEKKRRELITREIWATCAWECSALECWLVGSTSYCEGWDVKSSESKNRHQDTSTMIYKFDHDGLHAEDCFSVMYLPFYVASLGGLWRK